MKPIKLAMMSINHGHARGYYSTFSSNPNFEPVAYSVKPGYDDRVYLERLPKDVPMYHSDIEMLDAHPEIEAVIISSENDLHYEQVKLCAERGIHIFSMKIPTFDMDQYDEMIELVRKNDVICQVELEFHYVPPIRRAKELLDEGRIGKLVSFNAMNVTHDPAWWLPWHGIPEESYGCRVPLRPGENRYRGGALADHPHIFDIVRYISDSDYDFVYADCGPTVRKEIPEEDLINVVGRMKNGVIFSLDPSFSRTENPMKLCSEGWEVYPKRVEVYMTLQGTEGTITLDYSGPCVHRLGMPTQRFATLHSCRYGDSARVDEFAACIREHRQPSINLLTHRRTIEAMNASYESVYAGTPIYF